MSVSGAGAVVSSPGKQGTVRFCRRRLRFLLCRGGGIGKRVWSESRGMVVYCFWAFWRVKALRVLRSETSWFAQKTVCLIGEGLLVGVGYLVGSLGSPTL